MKSDVEVHKMKEGRYHAGDRESVRSGSKGVRRAIRYAETLLPGKPVRKGTDSRWSAIIEVGKYIETDPDAVWEFIRSWGSHKQEDLRDAVATCLLEHLLEYHFKSFFPMVRKLALADRHFGDTFLRCSKFGQAREPNNARRFNLLSKRLSLK